MQPFVPTHLDKAPVATEISVVRTMVGGEPAVVLQITTQSGMQFFYMDKKSAVGLSSAINHAAGGLVLPERR